MFQALWGLRSPLWLFPGVPSVNENDTVASTLPRIRDRAVVDVVELDHSWNVGEPTPPFRRQINLKALLDTNHSVVVLGRKFGLVFSEKDDDFTM